jgi:hypothetical protein
MALFFKVSFLVGDDLAQNQDGLVHVVAGFFVLQSPDQVSGFRIVYLW